MSALQGEGVVIKSRHKRTKGREGQSYVHILLRSVIKIKCLVLFLIILKVKLLFYLHLKLMQLNFTLFCHLSPHWDRGEWGISEFANMCGQEESKNGQICADIRYEWRRSGNPLCRSVRSKWKSSMQIGPYRFHKWKSIFILEILEQ